MQLQYIGQKKDNREMMQKALELVMAVLNWLAAHLKDLFDKVPPHIRRYALTALLVVTAAVASAVITIRIVYHPPSSPAPKSTLVLRGGVDLQKYCRQQGYARVNTTDSQVFCHSNINLSEACQFEYGPISTTFILADPNDPKRGLCYDRQKQQLGGIPGMSAYCRSQHPYAATTHAKVTPNKVWVCEIDVNIVAACESLYNSGNMEAKDEREEWLCYG